MVPRVRLYHSVIVIRAPSGVIAVRRNDAPSIGVGIEEGRLIAVMVELFSYSDGRKKELSYAFSSIQYD
jgi:hypothetical protein